MDAKGVLIVDLAKGGLGEETSNLLGSLLVTGFQQAALSRTDTPEEEREDFYLYVDEVQNFATLEFANILSEARKYPAGPDGPEVKVGPKTSASALGVPIRRRSLTPWRVVILRWPS